MRRKLYLAIMLLCLGSIQILGAVDDGLPTGSKLIFGEDGRIVKLEMADGVTARYSWEGSGKSVADLESIVISNAKGNSFTCDFTQNYTTPECVKALLTCEGVGQSCNDWFSISCAWALGKCGYDGYKCLKSLGDGGGFQILAPTESRRILPKKLQRIFKAQVETKGLG